MEKTDLSIPAISCNHCVMTIKNELSDIQGVTAVEGDAEKKKILVEYDSPATLNEIKAVLNEIGYPAEN